MKKSLLLALASIAWLAFAFDSALAQDDETALAPETTTETDTGATTGDESHTGGRTFGQLWEDGGVVMWFLTAASILTVYITADGFFNMRINKLAPPALVAKARELIAVGNYQELWAICQSNPSYFSSVLAAGLERIGRGKESVEHVMQETAYKEATLLKSKNTYLSVTGVVSPMIGLTGTVVGMIGAFAVLGSSGIADPAALSRQISHVLVATAAGLVVAIPAFIFYYILRNRATVVTLQVDNMVNRLVEDIPFEELYGLKIGENFTAGQMHGGFTQQMESPYGYEEQA